MTKSTWVIGAALVACTGIAVTYGIAGQAGASTTPTVATKAPAAAAALGDAAAATSAGATSSSAAPAKAAPAKAAKTVPRATSGVLSGKRQVTIVRVGAFEAGLSLTEDGRLADVDDDSGRQLFVPTPLGGGKFQIKAYAEADNHPASDEPSCWQVYEPAKVTAALAVRAAVCDAANTNQQFTITAKGKKAYAIRNELGFLQYDPAQGYIVQELGDAPLTSTFRLVDNGAARIVG